MAPMHWRKTVLNNPSFILFLNMGKRFQATSYELMRELVILSVNLHYVKDLIQKNERFRADLMYLNISHGPLDVLLQELVKRKVSLQKRFKEMVEFQLVEKLNKVSDLLIVIPIEQAGFRRKEMQQGWAIYPDIFDRQWLLNIRTGDLLESNVTNMRFFMENIAKLEAVYRYFGIDPHNPLPNKDIRY